MQVVVGVLCIVVGLVVLIGLRFIGPPGTRGHDPWTTHHKTKAALAGVVAIVAGVLLLTGGVDRQENDGHGSGDRTQPGPMGWTTS